MAPGKGCPPEKARDSGRFEQDDSAAGLKAAGSPVETGAEWGMRVMAVYRSHSGSGTARWGSRGKPTHEWAAEGPFPGQSVEEPLETSLVGSEWGGRAGRRSWPGETWGGLEQVRPCQLPLRRRVPGAGVLCPARCPGQARCTGLGTCLGEALSCWQRRSAVLSRLLHTFQDHCGGTCVPACPCRATCPHSATPKMGTC